MKINYPIIVYMIYKGEVIEQIFSEPPTSQYDHHYIKDKKFIDSKYDVDFEYFLEKNDAINFAKKENMEIIKMARNEIKAAKTRLVQLLRYEN